MRITLAEPGDLESYIDLLEDTAEWLNSRGFGQLPVRIYRDAMDYFALSIARGEVYFAFMGNDIVGSLRLLLEDTTVWPEANPNGLYLHNLLVRRAWSNRGLGHQMLVCSEQQTVIAGKTYLRLDCFASNAILRKYYENAGFEDRGEVDAQYPFGTLRLQRYEKQAQK